MAPTAATEPITPHSTKLEDQRPQEPAKRHRDVEHPDQPEEAPGRDEAQADPDQQAPLRVDAV